MNQAYFVTSKPLKPETSLFLPKLKIWPEENAPAIRPEIVYYTLFKLW